MSTRTSWSAMRRPDTDAARAAVEDEARITEFRELVFTLRTEAGLTQAVLAERMGTTQSAVARLEMVGANPRISTLERAIEALGRRLELQAVQPDVDLTQIDRHLAMTPAQRLRSHEDSARDLGRLLASARRVDPLR